MEDALKSNTSLTELDLGYNKIGDDGVKALANALKRNIELKERVCKCVVQLLCIRKFRSTEDNCLNWLDKNVVLLIAKTLWKTRTDDVWII